MRRRDVRADGDGCDVAVAALSGSRRSPVGASAGDDADLGVADVGTGVEAAAVSCESVRLAPVTLRRLRGRVSPHALSLPTPRSVPVLLPELPVPEGAVLGRIPVPDWLTLLRSVRASEWVVVRVRNVSIDPVS
jgi:hypothetical protein